jgi:hypothetical protein
MRKKQIARKTIMAIAPPKVTAMIAAKDLVLPAKAELITES